MTRLSVFLRLAFLVVFGASLAGCASDEIYTQLPREPGHSAVLDSGQKPLQCVPYAREHSDVKIYGDAWTWWEKAAGKFPRGSLPQSGAVMVLTGYAGAQRGHVAVVRKVVSAREIRVDHANWLDDGSIYLNDPVEDVSADNDWSRVRVYNIKTGGWGGNIYPVQGFIGSTNSARPEPGVPAPDVRSVRSAPAPSPFYASPPARPAAPASAARPSPAKAPPGADDSDPLPNPDMVISANIP